MGPFAKVMKHWLREFILRFPAFKVIASGNFKLKSQAQIKYIAKAAIWAFVSFRFMLLVGKVVPIRIGWQTCLPEAQK